MARTTTYGVFAVYKGFGNKLEVRPPAAFPTAERALAAARTFALVLGGAVAFSQAKDTGTGVTENGVIIGRFGVMAEQNHDASTA